VEYADDDELRRIVGSRLMGGGPAGDPAGGFNPYGEGALPDHAEEEAGVEASMYENGLLCNIWTPKK
jgi:hypothetical protein